MYPYSVHYIHTPLSEAAVVQGDWDHIYAWLTTKMRSRDEVLPYVIWDDENEYYISAEKFMNTPAVRDDPVKVFYANNVIGKNYLLSHTTPVVSGDEDKIFAYFVGVDLLDYYKYNIYVTSEKTFYPVDVFLQRRPHVPKKIEEPHRIQCSCGKTWVLAKKEC